MLTFLVVMGKDGGGTMMGGVIFLLWEFQSIFPRYNKVILSLDPGVGYQAQWLKG